MPDYGNALQILSIPHSAMVSIIIGMMIISFPLGIYVVYYTDAGDNITHHIPISALEPFGIQQPIPYVQMGEVFAAVWAIYAALFALALIGPGRSVVSALKDTVSGVGRTKNYMIQAVSWFTLLVLASAIIEVIQGSLGMEITPPQGNDLVNFYTITLAPLIEEAAFRVALVGLPLFLLYTHRRSVGFLLRALWHPSRHLHTYDMRGVFAIVVIIGVMFGLAHMATDQWGYAKIAQASVAGIILGYVYYKHGLVSALIVHWASNYFIYAYGNFVAHAGEWSLERAFEQSFFDTIQIILLMTGVISLLILIFQRVTGPKPANVEQIP